MSGFIEYDNFDAIGLAQLVRTGDISAMDLLNEAIQRTEMVNDQLNAVVYKHYDEARAAIEAGLPEGPFRGVPFLLKNLYMMMQGTITSNGSAAYRDELASYDSTLVQRYRQAGLVIFGKTNSPEAGLMPVTEPLLHGPARNPWNPQRTTGGSSGGAGAAVAAGILPVANASDGGGSIRIPASCNGLVGLKPTRGRTPSGPLKSEGWAGASISHVVSRSVRDSAAMLDISTGLEPGSPYTCPAQEGSFLKQVNSQPGKLKIAVARSKWGQGEHQTDVLAELDETISLLHELGHQVEEANPDLDWELQSEAHTAIVCTNTALDFGLRAEELGCSVADLELEPLTRALIGIADLISGEDYARAISRFQSAGRVLGRFHEQYDVILTPTMSREPIEIGYLGDAVDDLEVYTERLNSFMGNTALFNQTGQPSISLPLCWSQNNLPLGMMFSAAFGNDALLLRLAAQLEQARPWFERRPPVYAGVNAL